MPNLAAQAAGEEENSEATIARPPTDENVSLSKNADTQPPPSEKPGAELLNLPPPPPIAHVEVIPTAAAPLAAEAPPPFQLAPQTTQIAEQPAAAKPVAPFTPAQELPAFSAGAAEEAPSKFSAAQPPPPQKKSFGWIVVAALAIVVGTLVFFYMRRQAMLQQQPVPAPTSAVTAKPTAASPTGTPAATVSAATGDSAAPTTSASATTSADAASPSDAPPADPKSLPPTKGYVRVENPKADAAVFMFTTNLGPVNTWLEAPCKSQFLRPGKPAPTGPDWVASGKTVDIPCQGALKVTIP